MKQIFLIGGDTRSYWAAQHLQANGYPVATDGVPGLADTPLPESLSCAVLPFPSFQGALIRGRAAIPVEEILCRIHAGTLVFGGLFGIWKEAFQARAAHVFDLYGTEPLTTANAVPTAEGAIALAMEQAPITLHGANCLVIGFGRVGKILAHKLHALSANVTVSARKPADFALAEALGLKTDQTGIYMHGLGQYDFVFNTAPAEVFTRAQLETLPHECVLIELASKPYGISEADCRELGLSYHFAPGLPGKCAPKTAGGLYAQSILNILESEETT